jgi:hypothetical protein
MVDFLQEIVQANIVSGRFRTSTTFVDQDAHAFSVSPRDRFSQWRETFIILTVNVQLGFCMSIVYQLSYSRMISSGCRMP